MTTAGQYQQLQQELQNELTITNQLLRLISVELQKIKLITSEGGEFEANIKQNASLVEKLANMQQINIKNLPPMKRANIEMGNDVQKSLSQEQHDSFRNSMDESQ